MTHLSGIDDVICQNAALGFNIYVNSYFSNVATKIKVQLKLAFIEGDQVRVTHLAKRQRYSVPFHNTEKNHLQAAQ